MPIRWVMQHASLCCQGGYMPKCSFKLICCPILLQSCLSSLYHVVVLFPSLYLFFFCKFSVTLLFHTMNIINSNKLFYFTRWLSETQGHVGVWRSQWKTWQRNKAVHKPSVICTIMSIRGNGRLLSPTFSFAVSHFSMRALSLSLSLTFLVFFSLSHQLSLLPSSSTSFVWIARLASACDLLLVLFCACRHHMCYVPDCNTVC